MKKILLLFCAILAFCFVSCGGSDSSSYSSCPSGSNINFKGKSKARGHCRNNIYINHKTCHKFVEHPNDARYCATCGCSELDHWER